MATERREREVHRVGEKKAMEEGSLHTKSESAAVKDECV